jgi:hypothetical protein
MEQSPSWEPNSRSVCQEIPRLLLNPKVHYYVHYRQPLIAILSQMNPFHTFPYYFPKIHSVLFSHLRLDLPSVLFHSGFQTKIYVFLVFHACYMPHPSHPPWFDHPNNKSMIIMKYITGSPKGIHIDIFLRISIWKLPSLFLKYEVLYIIISILCHIYMYLFAE